MRYQARLRNTKAGSRLFNAWGRSILTMQNQSSSPDLEASTVAGGEDLPQNSERQDAGLTVSSDELPIFCPNPRMPLWSSHPKVFLELNAQGSAKCPYCGTQYQLEETSREH